MRERARSSSGIFRKFTLALAAVLASCRSTAPPSPAAPAAPADAGSEPASESGGADSVPIHGSLSSRFLARWTNTDHDLDFTEVVELEVGDRAKHPVTAYVLAEGLADLDGEPQGGATSPYFTLADTFDGAVTGRLLYAYANLHVADTIETFRVGRQVIQETPETVYFDGLRIESKDLGAARLRFGTWAGVPASLYSSSTSGDSTLGLFGETRPWRGGQLRLDWMHAADEGSLGRREDDLYGISASQGVGKSARIDFEHTRFSDEARDLRARASWYAQDSDLVLQASWYRLLETQGDLPVPFDPFYATLHDLYPYEQAGILASKSIGKHLNLQGGYDLRRVEESDDIGEFNRDFDRGFLTAGILGLLPAELDLSVTGEVWDSSPTDIRTFGADLSRRFGEAVEAAVGSYYSLFKYDLYQNRETDDVRTWYLKLAWKRTRNATLDVRYEFEDDEEDQYHSVLVGAAWRF